MASGLLNGHNGVVDHLENVDDCLNSGNAETGEDNCGPMSAGENGGADIRIKKKAKRLVKQFSKDSVTNGLGASVIVQPRNWKNTRRPRNGYGRGLPKKGGAGGKGVWGKLGSEMEEADVDMNDPNYDSDSFENGDIELKTIIPEVSDEELRKGAEPIILEYFEHGYTHEAALAFDELNLGTKRFMVVQLAIEIAMDHKPSHREMTSVLISDLYGRIVSQRDVTKAFDVLLRNLSDLILDTPDAPTILGNFLARAIADDCIPPKVITTFRANIDCDKARVALQRADTLLSMKHGLVRLDNVWGIGGGLRPVKYLIGQMTLLLKEYLSSGDCQEAIRCLQDLEVPHFYHELVYEAVVMTIEAINAQTEEMMCKLLKSLCDSVVITPVMLERGFFRVFEDMPDICLDVPSAYAVLERFVERCQRAGFLTDQIMKRVPCRGRKRFVSEGDGGRVKEQQFFD